MIFRFFMLKKTVTQNKRICELNKEYLHKYKDALSEDELSAMRIMFDLEERDLKEREIRFGKLCDVTDIVLYTVIAQIILGLTGFKIGSIVVQFILIFVMTYAFFIVNNKAKYLYLAVIFINLLIVTNNIWSLL